MKIYFAFLAAFFFMAGNISAQCETWIGSDRKEDAESAHSVYRQALKMKDYELAFEQWKIAYKIAPAADGLRDYHYIDGIEIYKHMYENTDDPAKKQEYAQKVVGLYKQAAQCYQAQAIKLDYCEGEQDCYNIRAGQVLGRAGYDMLYTFNMPRKEIYDLMKESVERSSYATEYSVIAPLAVSLVYVFQNDQIPVGEARKTHQELIDITEDNIENNQLYSKEFEQAKMYMDQQIAAVEGELYDCEYFKTKFQPLFEESKSDGEKLKYMYNKLVKQGCSKDDPFLQEVSAAYEAYAEKYNAELIAEMERKYPARAARRLYDEGKFEEAISKFNEAIEKERAEENDPAKIAEYYLGIASIQGRKLHQYSKARSTARKAIELRPNWGKPYMLIGDLYASTSRSCGDTWNQRLAVLAAIDKYAKARNVDPEFSSTATNRISKYTRSIPLGDQVFMRGFKKGDVVDVSCWIGEKVSLRYQ